MALQSYPLLASVGEGPHVCPDIVTQWAQLGDMARGPGAPTWGGSESECTSPANVRWPVICREGSGNRFSELITPPR